MALFSKSERSSLGDKTASCRVEKNKLSSAIVLGSETCLGSMGESRRKVNLEGANQAAELPRPKTVMLSFESNPLCVPIKHVCG